MPKPVQCGLESLLSDSNLLKSLGEKVAYVGNEASVTLDLTPGNLALHHLIGSRLDRLFGPQHGFFTVDQDNMIETDHQIHPELRIPVYSLYSETRAPSASMLDGLDTILIDLQDVGTRVYTYIWTMFLIMKACRRSSIRIIVLDRPNPIGGLQIEGNLPDESFYSFVCMSKIPMRHGLTIGEMARWFNQTFDHEVNLEIVPMKGWKRWMLWNDTGLPWINPSPNLPTPSGSLIYPGSVLIEGTTLSEGRGTTRSLEIFGHPSLEPYKYYDFIGRELDKSGITSYKLRPTYYKPTFDKFMGQICGGYQIHCTEVSSFRPWSLMQHILRILYNRLDLSDFWISEAYEYETEGLAIDYINGNSEIRLWAERNGSASELLDLESAGVAEYKKSTQESLLYTN